MNKLIAVQELSVVLLEKEKEKEIIQKKRDLKRLELIDKVEMKADFECARDILLASAFKSKDDAESKMGAEKIRKLAAAKADLTTKQKEAEAEVLRERAQAFQKFGNAAKLEMVLAILPRMTAEIAGPITDCRKITSVSQDGSVGFSRITNEILEVVEQICDSVGNITGQSFTSSNNNDDIGSPSNASTSGDTRPSVSLTKH